MGSLNSGSLQSKTMKHCQIFITSFIIVAISTKTSAKILVNRKSDAAEVILPKSSAEAFLPKHKECVSHFGLGERMCLPPNRPTNCSDESWKELHHIRILPCPTSVSKSQMEICPKLKNLNDTLKNMESCEKLEHFYNVTANNMRANLVKNQNHTNHILQNMTHDVNSFHIMNLCLEKEMELHASVIKCNLKFQNAMLASDAENIHKLALSIQNLEKIADPLILEKYKGHRLNHLNIFKKISELNYNVTGSYIPMNLKLLRNITDELKDDLAMSINHQLKEAEKSFNGLSFFGGMIFVTIIVLLSYFTLRCYKKKKCGSHNYHRQINLENTSIIK